MSDIRPEDTSETYQCYPHQQAAEPEVVPAEPTNAELQANRPAPTGANGVVLFRVVALLVLLVLIVFWIFPLDTWEFRIGP